MGGPGSGQWYRWDSKNTVEGTRYIDAGEMCQKGAIVPGASSAGMWSWTRDGMHVASVLYRSEASERSGWVRLSYTSRTNGGEPREMSYAVLLEALPSNLGRGVLWYFRCPAAGCGRRVKRIYAGGHVFACRRCYDLVHQSTRESHQARRLAAMLAPELGTDPALVELWLRRQDRESRQLIGVANAITRRSKAERRLFARLGVPVDD